MKPQPSDMHVSESRSNRREHHEHHWTFNHPRLTALLIACLVTTLVVMLLSIIHIYWRIGIWPLFG